MEDLVKLERTVFTYTSSIADKRFFKQRIVEFVQKPQTDTFTQYMFHALWERNNNGRTLKYCYFNEHSQRISIDKNFYKWMCEVIKQVENILSKSTVSPTQ